jgi:2-isopropylmalate synthase
MAAAYIGIQTEDGKMYWGAGTHTDISRAGIRALISAYNNMIR